jgi:hypothetical protein
MKTTARREGDVYVLNGSKNWISYATVADHALVFAKTDPEARHKGISAFVLEKGMNGFTSADTEHKLGIWAGSTGELYFDHVMWEDRSVLEFLDVAPDFTPTFSVENPNKRVRLPGLQRLIFQPPGPLIHVVPWLRRFPIVHRLRGAALRMNSAAARRPPMDPALRERLLREMGPEIRELGELIGRDLSHWLEGPVPRAA